MVRTFLRHFLLTTLLLVSHVTLPTTPSLTSQEHDALHHKKLALEQDLQNVQAVLNPSQFACLQTLLGEYKSHIIALLIDEKAEEVAFNEFVAEQGAELTRDKLLEEKKAMLLALEHQAIPLPVAQKFYATLIEMRNLAQQHQMHVSEEEEASSPASAWEQRQTRIAQAIFKNGSFLRIFMMDTEKELEKIEHCIAHAQKNEIINPALTKESILEYIKNAKQQLAEEGITQAELDAVFKELSGETLNQISQMMQGIGLPNDFLTYKKSQITKLTKELSAKFHQDIPVEEVLNIQKKLRAQKFVFAISDADLKNALSEESSKQSRAFWRKFGLAATTATLMGTADLLIQSPSHVAKATKSVFNKVFGTSFYFSQETPTKITTSFEGITGRMLQLISTIPAAKLYKEQSFDKLLNTQDPQLQMALAMMTAQSPGIKKAIEIAPYVIALHPAQKQATVDNAFAEACKSNLGGNVSSIAFKHVAPLLIWIGWLKATKNKELETALAASESVASFLINKDSSNAWNNAAFAAAPLAKHFAAMPIDNLLERLTPKKGVFLKSLLSAGWGSRLTEIGYQTLIRHQLWKQHNKETDGLWVKPDFGKKVVKTRRTTTYFQNGQEKTKVEEFLGATAPEVKEDPLNPTIVKDEIIEGHLAECKDMSPEEVSRYAKNGSSFWKKHGKSTLTVKGQNYGSATEAATGYATTQLKNLATEQVTKSALSSAFFTFNKRIAAFGKATAQKTARLALRLGLIKESTYEGWKSGAANLQQFVYLGSGLYGTLKSVAHDPGELLQNPEAMAKLIQKLTEDGAKGVSPQTQMLQMMVHRMFIDKLYKHVLQHLWHKAIPSWVEKGEKTKIPGAFVADTFKRFSIISSDEKAKLVKHAVNNTATVGKLAAYTTLWLAATAILSNPLEKPLKKPRRKPVRRPVQKQPAQTEDQSATPVAAAAA